MASVHDADTVRKAVLIIS